MTKCQNSEYMKNAVLQQVENQMNKGLVNIILVIGLS